MCKDAEWLECVARIDERTRTRAFPQCILNSSAECACMAEEAGKQARLAIHLGLHDLHCERDGLRRHDP
jgi:hypothetical protein